MSSFGPYLADAFDEAMNFYAPHSMSEAVDMLGSTRALADGLGVSQRTVERWLNYENDTGKQSRRPSDEMLDAMQQLPEIREQTAEALLDYNLDGDLDLAVEGELKVSNEKQGRPRNAASAVSSDDLASFWDQVSAQDIANGVIPDAAVEAFEQATLYGYGIHQAGEWTGLESVSGLSFIR